MSREQLELQFLAFRDALRSYLFRLTANRADTDDLVQATYLRALDKLDTFRGDASLKTWVFALATNLARDHKRVQRRWRHDTQDRCRTETQADAAKVAEMQSIVARSDVDAYEFREHVDYCFTCIAKSLELEQQIAIILKDIYQFSIAEVMQILGQTEGKAKHTLADARHAMTDIFDRRCALVNKSGMCYQCSEINGFVNPKLADRMSLLQLKKEHAAEIESSTESDDPDSDRDNAARRREQLMGLRAALIRNIDPLQVPGTDLHAFLLQLMADTD